MPSWKFPPGRGMVAVAITAAVLGGCSTAPPEQNIGSVDKAFPTPAVVASPKVSTAALGNGHWLSGASGDKAAKGSYGRWRHNPVAIGGTWDNGDAAQVAMRSICPDGDWAHWSKPLDIAVGAIDQTKGETWAAAAKGAYDKRWSQSWIKIKSCWGARNPANLYIRFAHEMNLGSMAWHVAGGQEANFARALTRYSNIRYRVMPRAKIVFCPSDGTDTQLKVNLRKLWPGKDAKGRPVANVYGIDTYNGYSVVHNTAEFVAKSTETDDSGQPLGIETHRQRAQDLGVPFAVCEWSNNGDPKDAGKGGDVPDYVKEMNTWFRDHSGDLKHPKAGQLIYEIQFNLQPQFMFLPTKLQPRTAAMYRSLVWGH